MFVDRPDASLLTLSFGAGGRPLLAVGGWIGSGEVWLEVAGHLGPPWRTITLDHRGTGASVCRAERIRVEDLVEDLVAVLDAYGIERAILAGESAGGAIVAEAALRHPDRIAGLAIVAGSWRRPVPGSLDTFVDSIRADFTGTVAWFADACLPEAPNDDLTRWGRQILQRANAKWAIQLLECRADLTVEDRLDEIRVPTLILHGSADVIEPPASSRELAAAIPESRLVILDGLGHAPMLSRPDLVAAEIDAFFSR